MRGHWGASPEQGPHIPAEQADQQASKTKQKKKVITLVECEAVGAGKEKPFTKA